LKTPLTISLAILKYGAPIEYVGSLTIPTPTGTMIINDVYLCDEIKGLIIQQDGLLKKDGPSCMLAPQQSWAMAPGISLI
jgi:hypothetical protein